MDKAHGRREERTLTASNLLNGYLTWPHVQQVFKLEHHATFLKDHTQREEVVYGLTSDGAQGLLSYLRQAFSWVRHQRCIWHWWRTLAAELAKAAAQAAQGLAEEVAKRALEVAGGAPGEISYLDALGV